MQRKDPGMLARFRMTGRCELCLRPQATEPHHWFWRKGHGGGGHLDMRENLMSLCRQCHDRIHFTGRPSRAALLMLVALREGLTVEELEERLYAMRRVR